MIKDILIMVLLFSFSLLSNAQNKAIDELASQKSLMSYNLGLCNADGFSKYIADTYKIDTIADIDIVLMGIEDEQDNYNLVDNRAYKIGRSLKPMIKEKMKQARNMFDFFSPLIPENIIDEDDESKTITVKITNDVEKLIAYRKISFDIIWWDAEGFRIPNEAIKEENGLSYVVRNRNGYYNKMLVKILKQNDEYCIVRQYKTEELEELGFTSSQIYSMRNIALYDEIVLNPTDEQMLQ